MKIKDAVLETVCGYTSVLPESEAAEIAFAGKSNVGKSSLINVLMNRKRLARVGETPGKTRTINFYRVSAIGELSEERTDIDFYLVDLPGYGYANVPEAEKAKWGELVERYLHSSKALKQVFLLVDIRHAPGSNDVQMYNWIRQAGYEPVVIATKADKIKRSQLQKQMKVIRTALGAPGSLVIYPFSALTRSGAEEIHNRIESVLTGV